MEITKDTPVLELTLGELASSLKEIFTPAPKYAYNYKEIANALGCCQSTVHHLRNKGVFKESWAQIGRKIVFDIDLGVQEMREYMNSKQYKNN